MNQSNLEDSLSEFGKKFRSYLDYNSNRVRLTSKFSQKTAISKLCIRLYLSKISSGKPFDLVASREKSYNTLCLILDLSDDEFVLENINLLYEDNIEFKDYRLNYLKIKNKIYFSLKIAHAIT